MSRNIGTVPAELFYDERLVYWEYLRVDWGGSFDITRATTFPGDRIDPTSQSLDIDGSTEVWTSEFIWEPGGFEQGESPLTISDIKFANADNEFYNTYVLGREGGVMGARATVYIGFFDKDEPVSPGDRRTFHGAFVIYDGLLDRAEPRDGWVTCSLLAGTSPLDQLIPRRRFTKAWGFNTLPPPNFKIVFPNVTFGLPNPTQEQTGSGPDSPGTDTPPPGNIGEPRTVIPVERERPGTQVVTRPGGGPQVVTRG